MIYKLPQRNWEGIQFEEVRKKVDPKFNEIHDELSDCYYDKKPFRTYGILTKEQFDKLHGLIFLLRDIALDKENEKQTQPDEKLRKQFNEIPKGETKKPIDATKEKIAQLKTEGIELKI